MCDLLVHVQISYLYTAVLNILCVVIGVIYGAMEQYEAASISFSKIIEYVPFWS